MYNLPQTGLLGTAAATSPGSRVSAEAGHSQGPHRRATLGPGWSLHTGVGPPGAETRGRAGGTRAHQREVNNGPVHVALIY